MKTRIWLVIIAVALASFGTGAAVASQYVSWKLAAMTLIKEEAHLRVLEKAQAQLQNRDVEGARSTLKQDIELQRTAIATLSENVRK